MTRPAALEELPAGGVGGQRRAVAGQGQADRLVRPVHFEFAVNCPEQDPQVGHADRSISPSARRSPRRWTGDIASIRSIPVVHDALDRDRLAGLHRPPETNTVGMLSRRAAISMPGVILSQFEMQTSASAQCAFTMYSTESAISSRLGSE